jgi:hypothetical protein
MMRAFMSKQSLRPSVEQRLGAQLAARNSEHDVNRTLLRCSFSEVVLIRRFLSPCERRCPSAFPILILVCLHLNLRRAKECEGSL